MLLCSLCYPFSSLSFSLLLRSQNLHSAIVCSNVVNGFLNVCPPFDWDNEWFSFLRIAHGSYLGQFIQINVKMHRRQRREMWHICACILWPSVTLITNAHNIKPVFASLLYSWHWKMTYANPTNFVLSRSLFRRHDCNRCAVPSHESIHKMVFYGGC